ncbi:glycosyltransferase family 4 protein [Vicingus serpentipes]|uniref:Glycosyltransferase family 4 protein n=1 Tax=Vicingus serpentipes TaxID=1926625 RepID=A0A5C6RXC5_9FLAO|nr:glycosyltransferase [Vicingus serpentipes]TXB66757.1 glycosyltransferase family 4 protein [Vicingus serpentipes]
MTKKKKIKVLRIINRFNLGGPTYNAAYLTKYLSDDFETLLVGGEKYEEEESSEFILEKLGLKPIIIPEMQRSINRKNDRIAYKKIKDIIKEFQPDIVHTHASKAGTLGRLAASKMKVPVIVHTFHGHVFHSYFGKAKTTFYKNIERYLAKKSSKIIAISDIQKNELGLEHKICKLDKIEVVQLGFDLSRFQEDIDEKRISFRNEYQVSEDEVAIGIIGRLVSIKNHKMFIDVVANVLASTTKKVRFFIVGDGEEKEAIKSYCSNSNIGFTEWNGHKKIVPVTFTSWIKNIDWLNAGLDIVVLTSLNEGTPVSLIEAQASNKPIVTTNVGGVKNITLENKTAYISEVNDINDFTQKLSCLIESENDRIKMGQKGWGFVKEKFSYERLTKDIEILYRDLLQLTKK